MGGTEGFSSQIGATAILNWLGESIEIQRRFINMNFLLMLDERRASHTLLMWKSVDLGVLRRDFRFASALLTDSPASRHRRNRLCISPGAKAPVMSARTFAGTRKA